MVDEVAAVIAELAAIEPTFKPLMERATGVATAPEAAIHRLRFEAPFEYGDSYWQFLNVLGGGAALMENALRLGLSMRSSGRASPVTTRWRAR